MYVYVNVFVYSTGPLVKKAASKKVSLRFFEFLRKCPNLDGECHTKS